MSATGLACPTTSCSRATRRSSIVALSGFGTAALDADRPGYASVFNAEGGLGAMTGYPDAPPSDIRDTNDLRGGTNACLAALAALWHVAHGGGGLVVDAATRDALVVLQGHLVLAAEPRRADRCGTATASDFAAPYDCFRSADGRWVAIGVRTDDGVGPPGPAAGRDASGRSSHSPDGGSEWLAAMRSTRSSRRTSAPVLRPTWLPKSERAGSPSGCPPLRATCWPTRICASGERSGPFDHPRLGDITLVGAPFRLHSVARPDYARPPLLGEHGELVAERLARRARARLIVSAGRRTPASARPDRRDTPQSRSAASACSPRRGAGGGSIGSGTAEARRRRRLHQPVPLDVGRPGDQVRMLRRFGERERRRTQASLPSKTFSHSSRVRSANRAARSSRSAGHCASSSREGTAAGSIPIRSSICW